MCYQVVVAQRFSEQLDTMDPPVLSGFDMLTHFNVVLTLLRADFRNLIVLDVSLIYYPAAY